MTDRHDASETRPAGRPAGALSRDEGGRDTRLLAALARGDHDALAALYEAWFGRALGLARAITRRDESFCLDVVQETFVRIIDHAPRLSRLATRGELDRWMGAVVRSAAIDLLRKELRRSAREQRLARSADSLGDGVERERADWLLEQLRALDPEDAELLALRFGRGATIESTARTVGVTIGAAYGRIRRAIARMKARFQEIDRE
ncbi:MAG: sigma-70 family RNA polymerase sigma factor [Phycisphaeraceae bacterium]|nr:sigma-70 family RNA polymerase sigma factor [Phycisphaeraceae bacterium]